MWKQPVNLCQFFLDEWCFFVSHTDKKLSIARSLGFFQTVFENGRAGRIGDLESVDEILFTVKESMKRQKMERPVRHNRDMARANLANERREQITVKLMQSAARRFHDLFAVGADILVAEQKFFDLKRQPFLKMKDPAGRAKRSHNARGAS